MGFTNGFMSESMIIKALGTQEAVQMICCMDKEYMGICFLSTKKHLYNRDQDKEIRIAYRLDNQTIYRR